MLAANKMLSGHFRVLGQMSYLTKGKTEFPRAFSTKFCIFSSPMQLFRIVGLPSRHEIGRVSGKKLKQLLHLGFIAAARQCLSARTSAARIFCCPESLLNWTLIPNDTPTKQLRRGTQTLASAFQASKLVVSNYFAA